MFKVESLDRGFPQTVDLMGYYISLERYLAREYRRLGDLAEDKFTSHLLHLMGKTSGKNASLLRKVFDELSNHGLVERPTKVLNGWSNISPKMKQHMYTGDDLQQSLRRYLAFEEYLKMEYHSMAEYFSSAAQNTGIPILNRLATVAENHEEYHHILKNLIKISDVDEMLVSIIG